MIFSYMLPKMEKGDVIFQLLENYKQLHTYSVTKVHLASLGSFCYSLEGVATSHMQLVKYGLFRSFQLLIFQALLTLQVIVYLFLIKLVTTRLSAVLLLSHAGLYRRHFCWLGMEERLVLMEGTLSHIHTAVWQRRLQRKL